MAVPGYTDIARLIDHAVLKPDATASDVENGAATALHYGTASFCIRPTDTRIAGPLLEGSGTALSMVVAFPFGAEETSVKLRSIELGLRSGVKEFDAVLNIGLLLSGRMAAVASEIREMTGLVHGAGQQLKIIFENCYLEERHIIEACRMCSDAGTDWVKTSTGFGPGGAVERDVELMRRHTDPAIGVKASGGIRTLDDLLKFRDLGCSRIGTSSTQAILEAYKQRFGE